MKATLSMNTLNGSTQKAIIFVKSTSGAHNFKPIFAGTIKHGGKGFLVNLGGMGHIDCYTLDDAKGFIEDTLKKSYNIKTLEIIK